MYKIEFTIYTELNPEKTELHEIVFDAIYGGSCIDLRITQTLKDDIALKYRKRLNTLSTIATKPC